MKKCAYKNRFYAAGVLAVCGGIHLFFDWMRYSSTLNSAPFSLWILVNLIGFGLPGAACVLIGWILRKRSGKGKDDTP